MVTDNAMCNRRLDEAPDKFRQGFPSNIPSVKGYPDKSSQSLLEPPNKQAQMWGTLVCVSTYTPDRTFRKCSHKILDGSQKRPP